MFFNTKMQFEYYNSLTICTCIMHIYHKAYALICDFERGF